MLALEPEVLILDEPTAGLDPVGRAHLLRRILALHENGTTLVLISHNMEELAQVCHHLYVVAEGRTVMDGPPAAIFSQAATLQELHLGVPPVTEVMNRLQEADLVQPGPTIFTMEQAVAAISGLRKGAANGKL